MKHLLATLLLSLAAPVFASAEEPSAPPGDTLQQALAEARARRAPIFIDFPAPWCHNCYFMQKNVMNGAEWEAVKKRAVVVDLDGDSPEGGYWFRQWKVGGYPTYVILDENGGEIGRILGDRPRAQFYKELNPILERGAALETLLERVKGADEASLAAAREVLRAWYEREDYATALGWLRAQPTATQAAVRQDATAGPRLQRIELLEAAAREHSSDCLKYASPVLGGALSCDLLVEIDALQSCVGGLTVDGRRQELEPFKRRFAQLQQRVLVTGLGECADTRGVVEVGANYYEELGDTAGFREVLEQGIAYSEKRLKAGKGSKKLDLKKDRGLADNLRFYFERLGDSKRLDALMPQLVAAYPQDYVYAFRHGRSLARRGQFAQALPFLERSAPKAYGRNRLWVEQWRAYTLVQLKREAEARKLVAATLQANGPWFPNEAARLKAAAEGSAPDSYKL
jgi:thiol-disulfide isomerase/thioredoxin